MKKILYILFIYIFLCSTIFSEEKTNEKRTVIINSAYNTEYKKVDNASGIKQNSEKKSTQDELIIFTGNVSISIKDNKSVSTIKADRIIYNKSRNTMDATGNVTYERKVGNKISDTFSGASMLFDVKKMEGVFLDGIVTSDTQKKEQRPYAIHAPIAGRNDSGTVAFKNGKLTTSTEDDPLWSIQASRIWLLPGNELSFANGFFSVGVVPIFYIPFFYYPADEMIFHPVFGYKPRNGYFTQTTTYLIGRKPLDTIDKETSFSNFLQADSLKKQKRHGVFLTNLDEEENNQEPNFLKLIADGYSSLGYLVGVDSNFTPKTEFINNIKFNTYFGFSKTLYPISTYRGEYTPFDNTGNQNTNTSNLFGKTVPFRYSANFSMSMHKNPINLSIEFPFVSDPFFKPDFLNRSENMNWFKFMLNPNSEDKNLNKSEQTSYAWKIQGNIRPSTRTTSPWLNSFSISNISTVLNFYSKSNETLSGNDQLYSPDRKFYYPQNIKPEIKMSVSGIIFSTSMLKHKKNDNHISIDIKNPFEENIKQTTQINNNTTEFIDDFIPTYQNKKETKNRDIVKYSLSYNIKGDFLHESVFDYEDWDSPANINWQKFSSHFFKTKYGTDIKSNLSIYNNVLEINNSLSFNQTIQRHLWIKDTSKMEALQTNNFKESVFELSNDNYVKIYPFIHNKLLKPTNLQWSINEIILKNEFDGDYTNPHWIVQTCKWNKNFIKKHSINTVFGVNLDDYTQKISFLSNLPPLLNSYSMSGDFTHPYGTININTKIFEQNKNEWKWDPFYISLNWKLPYNISMTQKYSYNIDEKESENLYIDFSWKYLSAFYKMNRTYKYKLDPAIGWQQINTGKYFIPLSAGLRFSNTATPWTIYKWKNRLKLQLSLASDINLHLQKITESYFTFKPSLTFKIHEFLDLKISTYSRNDVIARYFQNILNLPVTIPGEQNMIKDLAKSFYFWDTKSRQESGFKIKNIDISLIHYLKDWVANLTYSFSPEKHYDNTTKQYSYQFVPTITFSVTWKPIGDIRVKTKQKGKEFTVERGNLK